MRSLSLLVIVMATSLLVNAQIKMPHIFSNHMVLQRNAAIPVWGTAPANKLITLEMNGLKTEVTSSTSGNWKAYLPSFDAGGPYTLTIKQNDNSNATITFTDVLIGDVWLASGQSNMEWQVQQAKDATAEIKNANYPNIRYFNVPHNKSLKPENDTQNSSWQVCDTNSVKTLSAVAYYFSRELNTDLKVPIGIVQTTWGGTPVEAWTSREALLSSPISRQRVLSNDTLTTTHFVKDSTDLIKFWDIVYNPKNEADKKITQSTFDDSKWAELDMPKTFKDWGIPFYEGMVWLRKQVNVPASFLGKDLTLNLGHPEMNYSLYFNGHEICKTQWNANLSHSYTIPAALVKNGANTIAVRMAVLWGGGGFNPPADQMRLTDGTTNISLTGNWKYQKDIEPTLPKIYNYQYYPTYLYNAMVNPVVPYGLKGFIWYQGEANDSAAYNYRSLLPMMMNDWRVRFQQGYLPFLIVQLPNYMKAKGEPSESQWAEMREAQWMASHQPNSGLVCTIDLGNPDNIHPINKQPVGHRLALVAKKSVYGIDCVASGPEFESFKVEGKKVIVHFKTASPLCLQNRKELKGFAIAGADQKFYWADAKIDGNNVILSCKDVPAPVAVRYNWADNPDGNLFNSNNLPTIPFRTDRWKGITQK